MVSPIMPVNNKGVAMSASSHIISTAAKSLPQGRRDPRPLLWIISLGCTAVIAVAGVLDFDAVRAALSEMGLWVPAFVIVNMLPVTAWKHTPFVPDMPLLVLATLVLRPAEAALVVFVGALDPRELRREITPTRAMFNRSQIALVAFLGSAVAHGFSEAPDSSVLVVPLALLALATIVFGNTFLVCSGVAIDRGYPFSQVLRRMLVGEPSDYAITLSMAALSAGAFSILYSHSREMALIAALGISLLSRQTLARSQKAVDTGRAYRSREQAMEQVSRQIHEERSDERRLIAAELHDEVLQPLFKVTLMAQVLKGDLAGGRLLELDQDLPELLTAADLASTTLRELIGDLRRSALGRGGLSPALDRFLRTSSERSPCELHSDIESVAVSPDAELALYQIAKEATTNALTHSRARNIWVALHQEGNRVELSVSDDGIGFDPTVIPTGHLGVEIMRERASAISADLWVDSAPDGGTRILLSVERQLDP
jgi:signal transduction histidine kinase